MTTTINRRKIWLGLASMAVSELAVSEQCWQLGGCANLVGWFRVNKYSDAIPGNVAKASEVLFGARLLPLVNEAVTIKRVAYLRRILWGEPNEVAFHDKRMGKGEIQSWQPVYPNTDPETDYMAPGTKVRILGYHSRDHLFALVQIISYPPQPYEAAETAKYDLDQVI